MLVYVSVELLVVLVIHRQPVDFVLSDPSSSLLSKVSEHHYYYRNDGKQQDS